MAFNVAGARKAGYSDAEIADYLASQSSFKLNDARSAGYSDTEIVDFLSGYEPPKPRQPKLPTLGTGAEFKDEPRGGLSSAEIATATKPFTGAAPGQPTPAAQPERGPGRHTAGIPAAPQAVNPPAPPVNDPAAAAEGAMRAEAKKFVPLGVKDGQELEWLKINNPDALAQLQAGVGKQAADGRIKQGAASFDRTAEAMRAKPGEEDSAWEFSVDQAEKLIGKGAQAVGGAMGLKNIERAGREYAEQQEQDIDLGGYKVDPASLRERYNEEGFVGALKLVGTRIAENWAPSGVTLAGSAAAALAAVFSAPAAAVLAGTTAAGAGLMGVGEVKSELEDQGIEGGDGLAVGAGALIGLLDMVGAGKVIPRDMLTRMTGNEIVTALVEKGYVDAAKAFAKEIGKKAAFEGVTEMAQEGIVMGAAGTKGAKYEAMEIADRLIDGAVIGAAMGGGVGTVSTGVETARAPKSASALAGRALLEDVDARNYTPGAPLGAGPTEADYRGATKRAFGGALAMDGTPPRASVDEEPPEPETRPQAVQREIEARKDALRGELGIAKPADVPAADMPAADEIDQDQLLAEAGGGEVDEGGDGVSKEQPGVQGVAINENALPQSERQDLRTVRSARNNGVPGMAGELRDVPESRRQATDAGAPVGQDRQQPRVQPGQRQVGDSRGAGGEQEGQYHSGDQRNGNDPVGVGQVSRDQPIDAAGADRTLGIGESTDNEKAGREAAGKNGYGIREIATGETLGRGNRADAENDIQQAGLGVAGRESIDGAAAPQSGARLSIGPTPQTAEPITVKDGVIFIGRYSAQHFETGEDILVPNDADGATIAQALRDAGAVGGRQRIYGVEKPADVTPTSKVKKIKRQAEAKKIKDDPVKADEYASRARKTFIRAIKDMGGVKSAEASDIAGEKAHMANRMAPGLFRREGNALDLVARRLNELGYLSDADYNDVDGGVQAVLEMIGTALAGEPVFTAEEADRYRELLAREQDLAEGLTASEEALADAIEAEASDADALALLDDDGLPDIDAAPAMDEADAMRALGFTEDEINAATESKGQDPQQAGRPAAGAPEEGARPGRDAPQDAGFELAGETPEQVKAREKAAKDAADAKAKADAAAEARAKADAERDSFTLTGSARAADANPNQGDIFSQPAARNDATDVRKPGINPDNDENAPQWAGQYDVVEKGGAPAGYIMIGRNPDGDAVYEAGGMRAVVSGDYVVRELAHKPKQGRVAEFKTADEVSPPTLPPLTQAMNDLADVRQRIEDQGRVVDDRLLERERQLVKLVNELEQEGKPQPSANKVFTEDAAAAARALLKKKLGGQLNSGIDPEVMQAGITLAGYHIEKGARSFAAYAKAMIDDLGDVVKPYLKSWYAAVSLDPRAAGFDGMDSLADMQAADVDALAAAPPQFVDDRWDAATPAERKAFIEQAGRADIADNYKGVAWADLSDNMRARLAIAMNAPVKPAAPKPVTPQVAPDKPEASPVQAQDKPEAEPGPVEFKKGDRVQITDAHWNKTIAGRHGEIVDVKKTTWTKSVIDLTSRGLGVTKREEETHTYYDIKTDAGFIAEGVQVEQIEAETGRVDATPDPVVDGKAMTPDGLQQAIKRSQDQSRDYMNKSSAARLADKKAEWRRMAVAADAETTKLMRAWTDWSKTHGGATAETAAQAAPAADAAGVLKAAGLTVTASKTKNGTPTWEVSGNTREHSETIKRLGGRWYGPKKVWSFYKGDPSADLAKALAGTVKAEPSRAAEIAAEAKAATLNPEVNNDAEQPRVPEQARPQAGDDQGDRGDGRGREPGSRPLGGGMAEADARAGEGRPAAGSGEGTGRSGAGSAGVRGAEPLGGRDREPSTLRDRPERTPADGLNDAKQTPSSEGVSLSGEPRADFTIGEDTAEAIEEGGQKTKARNNIAAIRLVKKLAAEDRRATMDEQKALAKYVGWGGIKQIFDDGKADWAALRDELKNLLTAEEYAAANRSILDAHFTSMDIVSGMWAAARHLGFHGGRVLEPSVGVGNFYGAMPKELRANSTLFGVELDNITGQIAKHLYPNATIATPAGFQDVDFPSNSFDFATGNPPFGDQSLFDRAHPEFRNFSIHQFFFAKALDKVRPGGILQMVVSRYLMDSRDAAGFAAREHLAKHARLLGAIRLPYNAFLSNANTEVVTDIIFLQKLEEGETGNPEAWTDMADVETVHPKTGERHTFSINRYFADHPEMVVGTHAPTGKMRQANQYNVEPPAEPLSIALGKAVANLPRDAYRAAGKPLAELASADAVVPEGTKVYGYYLEGETVMQRLPDSVGKRQAAAVEFKDAMAPKRAAGMIGIRDTLRGLMRAELSEESSDASIDALRAELNSKYNAFRKTYGYINQPANRRAFRDDPDLPLLESLEPKFDPGLGTAAAKKRSEPARRPSAEKADIFTKRVLQPVHEVKSVTSAKDALVVSLNERGRIDPEHMADIYGKPWDEIRRELGDLIYLDPNGAWETADAYLSGNVKAKLKHARAAAERDSTFAANVAALEAVQPADVPALKISVRLGSPWVPSEDMARFAAELFGAREPSIRFVQQVAKWSVRVTGGDETARLATWGTRRVPAEDVLEHVLNNKQIVVKDNRGTAQQPNWVVNEPETEAARAKAQDMSAKFKEWIWQDQERRNLFERIYNDNYNTDVRRKYDGSHLTLPGSSPAIQLRPHQKAAIWRAIQDRSILLDHVVGAGKTFEMAGIAMEMRRLGIARKPMFMVPNSLVRQWRDEFYKLYPNANVLAATEADFAKANRRRFMAKIATGDWDAVIVAHSSFKKIGMPAATEKAILEEQLNEIADAIEEMKRERGDRNIMRDMERMKEKIAERLKALSSKGGKKDDVVSFDELGTDAMLLDEAHLFKNLFYMSGMRNVAGLGSPTGSGRAFDLFVKLRYLDMRYSGKAPVVFATGTPVSNSLVEMFTMQRYMAWGTLKDRGLHLLDAWAGVYGDVQNVYEVHPSGTGYRLSTRFAKFVNLPSLMDLYRGFADVVTMDDLKDQAKAAGTVFPVPKIKGGRPQNIVADRSEQQTRFFGVPEFMRNPENGDIIFELPGTPQDYTVETDEHGKFYIAGANKKHSANGKTYETWDDASEEMTRLVRTPKTQWNKDSILWKFENLKTLNKASKGKINALSITNEARKAGLDFRLIDPSAPDFAGSKINQAVTNAVRIHKAWAADRGTQLIFCDLSVPQSAKAAAAAKERDAFVRREDGSLEKVAATVAAVEGIERAFLVVKRGTGDAARFMVYDGITGADLEIEVAKRADAPKAIAEAFETDVGMADRLEQFSEIDDAEIADWKDANEKETAEEDAEEGDGAITMGELLGLSGGAKFSVYDDIKAKLIAQGVPESEIAFIHDYDTAAKKNDLFKKVNDGDIRILLGSTEKMGAGMNVQKRLVALHHLDAPWRPSDLEQREGRIVRQGNELYKRDPDGFEVEILRYGTKQTYDTRMWQIIEHKAAGVEQLRKAGDDLLEIDDVGGEAANAADMKAAASGNPLILEEIKLRNEVKSLEAQQFGHIQARAQMQDRISLYRRASERLQNQLAEILPFKNAADAHPAKPFAYKSPAGKVIDDVKNVTTPISEAFVLAAKGRAGDVVQAGAYRGLAIEFYRVAGGISVNLAKGDETLWVASYEMEDKFSPAGLFTRIDNALSKMAEREQDARAKADRETAEIPKLEAEVDKPFAKEEELKAARQKHRETVSKLAKAGGGVELSPGMKEELKLALVQRMIQGRNGVDTPATPYVAQPGTPGYSDPYESPETRPNTRPGQLEAGRAALADVERRILGGKRAGVLEGASLLGSAISRDFRAAGGVSLVGQTARTAHDLAVAAQVLRDPRFETFRVFFTDKAGKIVGERAYSSRLPGTVYYPNDLSATIKRDMASLKADGYWLLHNHPSGSAKESDADIKGTNNIALRAPGLLGHVIIDHNEYNHIRMVGAGVSMPGVAVGEVIKAPELAAINLSANHEAPHPLLGEKILSPMDLARMGKQLQKKDGYAVLIGTDPDGNVQMLTEVPTNLLKNGKSSRVAELRVLAAVKRAARETGSYRLFAVVPDSLADYRVAVESGLFVDVVDVDSRSAIKLGLTDGKDKKIPVSRVEQRGGKSFVNQLASEYRARQTDTAAFRKWFGDSKVVDESGKPLVVYHGTHRDFSTFDGKAPASHIPLPGFYFSPDADRAGGFAESGAKMAENRAGRPFQPIGANVMPVFLSINNPAEIDASDAANGGRMPSEKIIREMLEKTKEQGHDGAIIRGWSDGSGPIQYVAFNPGQIKSATGNRGTFDPGSPNIVESPATPYGSPPSKPTGPKQTPPKGGVSASVPAETRARKAQRIVQDQFNRFTVIQEWLRDNGVKLENRHDVYRAEERMHGKIAAQIEDFREKRLQPLVVKIHKAGFDMKQVGEYLVANHAAERNAQIAKINPGAVDENGDPNGSGMTDAEAQAVLDRFAKLADFGKFEALAEEFRAITDDTKQILLDGGVISREMADAWGAAYQHYVPLRGGPEEPGMGDATGKGVSVNARAERRRAMGHQARDEWVIENIINAHERAIYLTEKNRVGQYLVALAAAVPDSRLWTIDKPVKRKVLRPGQAFYVVEHKGVAVGSFDSRNEADLFVTAMVTSGNKTPSDFTVTRTAGDPQVAYMASGSLAENEVQVYVKGQMVRIQLNDPLLARAYKKMGQTHLTGILEIGRQVNTFLSKAYTGYNPEFIVSNVQRDLISGSINITGEHGAQVAAKAWKYWIPSLRAMLRYSMTGKSDKWIDAYRQDGGNTGGAYLGDLERIGKDVQTAYEEAVGVRQLFAENKAGKATKVALRKSFKLMMGWIQHMNAAAENGIRVALYRAMIEEGKGRAAAAAAAKNSTVNFNRRGEIGTQLGALYLFANPAIQGSASMGHALFKGKHKEQAWALMGSLAGLAYLLALGYGDDDEWDEIPQGEKDRNMLIRVGDHVVKVAVPYGHGIAFALGNAIYDLQRGKDVTEHAYHMASSILENIAPLNPLGDKPDLRYAMTDLTPFEPFRIFARVANNVSGFQRQIMPESKFDETQPDFLKAYRNTHGSVYDQLTRGLSAATGGTATQAGAIDVSPETIKFLFETATGGTGRFFMDSVNVARLAAQGASPELVETPIARKFVRDANRASDSRRRFWETVNKAEAVLDDYRRAEKSLDYAAAGKFEGMQLGGLSRVLAYYKDVSGQARDAVAQIKAMENKTAAEKRLMIFEVEKKERELYRRMVKDIESRVGAE